MKLSSYLLAAGFALGMAGSAQAGVLFSDNFQTSLSASKWAVLGSAQIVGAPVGAGNAMNFTGLGSGGNLFSQLIAGTGAGHYSIQFDYYSPTAGGGGGFIGLIPTATTNTVPFTGGTDDWLASDTPGAYPTPFSFTSGAGFTHVNLLFDVTSNTAWGLKIEDFSGSGPIAGDAYFQNLAVSSVGVPEPLTLSLFGAGLAGAMGLRRRKNAKRA